MGGDNNAATEHTMDIHTGDGTWSTPINLGPGEVTATLPLPCPLRGANRIVIIGDLWDQRFQNAFAAENIARRVGGRVFIVGEGQTLAYAAALGLPVCASCGPGWLEGGMVGCPCGALQKDRAAA